MEHTTLGRTLRSLLLTALFAVTCSVARAQEPAADTSVIPDPIGLLEARINAADVANDTVAAATARLDLAELVKPSHALRLTREAAMLLDSAATSPELALRTHKDLAQRYTQLKSLDKANHEWAAVARLTDVLRKEAVEAIEKEHFVNAVSKARIDSLTTALGMERASAENALQDLAAVHARRERSALYAIAGGLFMLLLSVVLFWVYIRKQRSELKELRQEAIWLRMVSKKGTEPTVVASSAASPVLPKVELPQVLVPVPPPPTTASDPEEEAMLLALVRRRGEERLLTLREARARGDNDKVVRVVHTMKPQLVSLDAPYFQELCGRLVSTDPRAHPDRWAEDLDRFEAGMARVIAERG